MKPEIKNPCFEDIQLMKDIPEGKYCQVCQKKVIDFTNMTDKEIKIYLKNNNPSCGIFFTHQLEQKSTSFSNKLLIFSSNIKNNFVRTLLTNLFGLVFKSRHTAGKIDKVEKTVPNSNKSADEMDKVKGNIGKNPYNKKSK